MFWTIGSTLSPASERLVQQTQCGVVTDLSTVGLPLDAIGFAFCSEKLLTFLCQLIELPCLLTHIAFITLSNDSVKLNLSITFNSAREPELEDFFKTWSTF